MECTWEESNTLTLYYHLYCRNRTQKSTCVFETTPIQSRTEGDRQKILTGKLCMEDHTECVWKNETSYISLRTGCLRMLLTFGGRGTEDEPQFFTWNKCTRTSNHVSSLTKLGKHKKFQTVVYSYYQKMQSGHSTLWEKRKHI